jgi:hypothetical protein
MHNRLRISLVDIGLSLVIGNLSCYWQVMTPALSNRTQRRDREMRQQRSQKERHAYNLPRTAGNMHTLSKAMKLVGSPTSFIALAEGL